MNAAPMTVSDYQRRRDYFIARMTELRVPVQDARVFMRHATSLLRLQLISEQVKTPLPAETQERIAGHQYDLITTAKRFGLRVHVEVGIVRLCPPSVTAGRERAEGILVPAKGYTRKELAEVLRKRHG